MAVAVDQHGQVFHLPPSVAAQGRLPVRVGPWQSEDAVRQKCAANHFFSARKGNRRVTDIGLKAASNLPHSATLSLAGEELVGARGEEFEALGVAAGHF